MNDLVTMSDSELDNAIEEIKNRELTLKTEAGQKYIVGFMRGLMRDLEKLGYKTDADELVLARLWANNLDEEFARLGEEGMRNAIQYWVANDTNEYRTFPQIPWIKEACKQVGGDPLVEKGRREQAEAERKLEEEHKREMENLKKERPDLWEMSDDEVAQMARKKLGI